MARVMRAMLGQNGSRTVPATPRGVDGAYECQGGVVSERAESLEGVEPPGSVKQFLAEVLHKRRGLDLDPVTIGAVLLAVVSGAGGQLGAQLWAGGSLWSAVRSTARQHPLAAARPRL
jgi:hypothetical protein